jgi:hypothetical protein
VNATKQVLQLFYQSNPMIDTIDQSVTFSIPYVVLLSLNTILLALSLILGYRYFRRKRWSAHKHDFFTGNCHNTYLRKFIKLRSMTRKIYTRETNLSLETLEAYLDGPINECSKFFKEMQRLNGKNLGAPEIIQLIEWRGTLRDYWRSLALLEDNSGGAYYDSLSRAEISMALERWIRYTKFMTCFDYVFSAALGLDSLKSSSHWHWEDVINYRLLPTSIPQHYVQV